MFLEALCKDSTTTKETIGLRGVSGLCILGRAYNRGMRPDVQRSRLYRESDKWFERLRDRRRAFMRRCSVAVGSLATGL